MIGIHGAAASAVVAAYDFETFGSIIDVGGGTGTLLKTILKATRRPHGVLFDLPETAKAARDTTVANAKARNDAVQQSAKAAKG